MKFIVKKEAVLGQNICKEKNMENKKNEFDDIILEKTNKSEKIKKILLRIIALVILFLVVMIVMKLINGKEEQNPIIPSEPTENSQNSNNNGFENMPITEQNDTHLDDFERLRRQLQGDDDSNVSVDNEENDTNATQAILPTQSVTEDLSSQDKKNESNQQTPAPKKTTPVKTKTEAKKEPSPKKDNVKESNKEPQDLFKNIQTGDLTPGLYVQIFSVSNLDQKSKELAAVKKKGYDYKLYKTSSNGKEITKVLIGPFDKNELTNELAKIRKDIAKDAFSFTLK